jgi:hypothetical protein
MLKRTFSLVALLVLPLTVTLARSPQAAQAPPMIIVRVASLDSLFQQWKALGAIVGSDSAEKLEAMVKDKLGPKGLEAISANRPLAFYGRLSDDISLGSGVIMLPIASEKQFKDMLEAIGWEVAPAKDGIHAVKQSAYPLDIQYRTANGYAYVGIAGPENLKPTALLKPEVVFTDKSSAPLSLTVRIDQVPPAIKDMLLEGIKSAIPGPAEEKNSEKGLNAFLNKGLANLVDSVLKDGDEFTAGIGVDPKTKELAVDATLKAKAGSKLAGLIAKVGERKSLFAGIAHKDAAANFLVNIEAPEEWKAGLGSMVQDALNALQHQFKDAGRLNQAKMLLDALKPSLTSGNIDMAISLRGPHASKHYTLVAGFKLKDGNQLAGVILALTKELPEKDRASIDLNADKAGDVSIHRLRLTLDENAESIVGKNPIYIAIRDDALFAAMGEDGLKALKEAIASPPAAAAVQFDASMARLALLSGKNTDAAKKALESGDNTRMRFALEGGPVLRMRLSFPLAALPFFGLDQ